MTHRGPSLALALGQAPGFVFLEAPHKVVDRPAVAGALGFGDHGAKLQSPWAALSDGPPVRIEPVDLGSLGAFEAIHDRNT